MSSVSKNTASRRVLASLLTPLICLLVILLSVGFLSTHLRAVICWDEVENQEEMRTLRSKHLLRGYFTCQNEGVCV